MIADFLAEQARVARAEWDCGSLPAAWCVFRGMRDPRVDWPASGCPDERVAIEGGLALVFGARLEATGWRRREGPAQLGDIGVLELLGEAVGALFAGDKWAVGTPRGLGFIRVPDSAIVAAWGPK